MNICVLEYVEKSLEAAKRLSRGERQLYCGACSRWQWPEECAHEGRLTMRQFKALCRRIEEQVGADYPSERARSSSAWQKEAGEGEK